MNLKEAKKVSRLEQAVCAAATAIGNAQDRITELEAEIAERRMDYGEDCKRLDARIAELERQLAAEQAECERLRIQLAACGVAANANTWESAAEMRLNDKSPYWSESYSDVCNAVNREIEHRGAATVLAKEREELREQLAAAQERDCWIPISDGLPTEISPVLVAAQNKKGEVFVLRAAYAHKHELELSEDQDDDFGEYDEVSDIYYCPEGWYEWNYTDETHYYLSGLTVTHWRELPDPPQAKE